MMEDVQADEPAVEFPVPGTFAVPLAHFPWLIRHAPPEFNGDGRLYRYPIMKVNPDVLPREVPDAVIAAKAVVAQAPR